MKKLIPILLIIAAITGCSNEFEYTRGKCYLAFDNSVALVPQLAAAMNSVSTGVYCHISRTYQNGVAAFSFADFGGSKTISPFNATQQQMTLIFGRSDQSGVIVGFNIFGEGFKAFDMQCPECSPLTILNPSTPLSWTAERTLTCKQCNRAYDLTTGISNDGRRLTIYQASTTGPFGYLAVH